MADKQGRFDRILEICLQRLQSGEATLETILVEYPDQADELRPMLEAVDWLLDKRLSLAPRPEFISASRSDLVAKLRQEQTAAAEPAAESSQPGFLERMRQWLVFVRQPFNRRVVLQFVTVIVLLLGMVTGGVTTAYASQEALPGEVLYPVKISLEQVALFLSLDESNDIYLHMHYAWLRTNEMQDLVTLNRYFYLRDTLANYQYHVSGSIQLVRVVAENNLAEARVIAPDVHRMVLEQPAILKSLAQSIPEQIFSGMVAAVQVSEGWVQEMESIVEELEVEPTPTPGMENPLVPSSTSTATFMPQPTLTNVLGALTTPFTPGTSTLTQTPTGTSSLFPLFTLTKTSTPRPGSTRVPPDITLTFTATPVTTSVNPTSTSFSTATQPVLTATRTLPPAATSTSPPTATKTSPPTATSTIPPPPTATVPPPPTATATSPPPPTATTPPYP